MFRYLKELLGQCGKLILYLLQRWYITIPVFILLLLLPLVLGWFCVLFSNLFYSVRLMNLCKKKHFSFQHCEHGLEIRTGTETFRIYFLLRNFRKKKLYLFDRETVFISKPKAQLLVSKWFGQFGGWKGYNEYESMLKKIHLPKTHKESCIVVVNPAPIEVYLFCGNKYQPTGSGVQLQDKIFYFGKDFINFLSRKEGF